MAIARGAGTEILRASMHEGVNSSVSYLIWGVPHHIYTVLSVIFRCMARSGTEQGYMRILGYDAKGGDTQEDIHMATITLQAKETYVWDDKFVMNGGEGVSFSGELDNATKQDAIADQAASPAVAQKLQFYTDGNSTTYDVVCSYIDQNNE